MMTFSAMVFKPVVFHVKIWVVSHPGQSRRVEKVLLFKSSIIPN